MGNLVKVKNGMILSFYWINIKKKKGGETFLPQPISEPENAFNQTRSENTAFVFFIRLLII